MHIALTLTRQRPLQAPSRYRTSASALLPPDRTLVCSPISRSGLPAIKLCSIRSRVIPRPRSGTSQGQCDEHRVEGSQGVACSGIDQCGVEPIRTRASLIQTRDASRSVWSQCRCCDACGTLPSDASSDAAPHSADLGTARRRGNECIATHVLHRMPYGTDFSETRVLVSPEGLHVAARPGIGWYAVLASCMRCSPEALSGPQCKVRKCLGFRGRPTNTPKPVWLKAACSVLLRGDVSATFEATS